MMKATAASSVIPRLPINKVLLFTIYKVHIPRAPALKCCHFLASKQLKRRRKVRQEDLKIVEGDTKDVLVEKFILLRDAYDEILDEKTRLEYEVESLKDDHEELENEVQLK